MGASFALMMLASTAAWAADAGEGNAEAGTGADSSGDAPVSVPAISVTGEKANSTYTGKAEEGYRQTTVNMGPLGERKALDTPYSVYSVPSDLIKNQQVETFTDLAKYIPSLQQQGHPGLEFGPPVVRGLVADDQSENTRIDGMSVRGDTALPIELYDRLEVLSGPAGAYYGASYPAGTINGILKRPTETPLNEVSLGYSSEANGNLRADLSGHVDEGHKLGYRANLLHSDGEGYVAGSNLNRDLASLALDLQPTDDTLIQANASRYYFNQKGYPGGFAYGNGIKLPDAPDPSKQGYGQSFGGITAQTDLYELKAKHDFNADWHIEAGILRQVADRWFDDRVTNTLTDNNGTYRTNFSSSGSESFVTSNMASLNGKVDLLGMQHELSLGTNGFDHTAYSFANTTPSVAGLLGYASLSDPTEYSTPKWYEPSAKYKASNTRQETLVQNDTITITDQWSVLAGLSESWLNTKNFSTAGALTSAYEKSGALSPTGALMFKPRPNMTTYFSYSSSVQQGDTAPTGATNAGQSLAPYRSQQYEVGYKVALSGVDLTSAVFDIERPFATTGADSVFRQVGSQTDKGVELTAKGKPTDDITVFGGVTWLDTHLEDLDGTTYAGSNGNQVVGIPEWQANLLTEYTIPKLRQVVASVNLHYTGRRAANAENTSWADGYFTTDLGVRYQDEIKGHKVTWRASVENLFDEHYWLSVNGNMSGQSGATNTAYLGAPRTFKASMAVQF